MIGPGTHVAKVKNHVLAKTSTGIEQIAVTFETDDGTITWYGYFTDKAIKRTIESLKILGWNPEEHDHQVASLHDTGLLVGAEAEIVVENEEYDGRTRAKVRWVNSIGTGEGVREKMDPGEAEAFSTRMRGNFVTATPPKANSAPGKSPGNGSKPRPKPQPAPRAKAAPSPEENEGEDIPF